MTKRIIRKVIDLNNVQVEQLDITEGKGSTTVRFRLKGICVDEFDASRPRRPQADDDSLARQRTNLIGEKAQAKAQYEQIITTEVKIMPWLHLYGDIGLAKVSGDMVTIWINSRNETIVKMVIDEVMNHLNRLVIQIVKQHNHAAQIELRQDTRPTTEPGSTSKNRVIRLNRKRSFNEFHTYSPAAPEGVTLAELIKEGQDARKAARLLPIALIKVTNRIGPIFEKEFGELYQHVNYIQVHGAMIRIVLKPSASPKDEQTLRTIASKVATDYNRAARTAA